MRNPDCLSEQDLTLHFYGELPADGDQVRHLADCPQCTSRFAALADDLEQFPNLDLKPDYAAGTRMAASVAERLRSRRRKSRFRALAVSTVVTVALAITIYSWEHRQEVQTVQLTTPALSSMTLNEDMPDIEFLDDLEVLNNLELLRQIEGV
jgi:predicted anti-sigma-YlaC factor YlaD